ncbi:hypothetical protein DPX16_18776 [Anabarilius grahami]|uniref:Uncharacterized protein n=1 Tax=Anabarilius grahami TaxID=495550 RepID=A0A3N0Y217_ANAGA|nr:hypothetical protein DPX16_18776 [Anabarilius grahami]
MRSNPKRIRTEHQPDNRFTLALSTTAPDRESAIPREAALNPIRHPPSEAFTIDLHCCERYKAGFRYGKSASLGRRASASVTPPDAVGHSHTYGVEGRTHHPTPSNTAIPREAEHRGPSVTRR